MNWHSELVAQGCLVHTPRDNPLRVDDGAQPKSTFFRKNYEKLGSSVPQYAVGGLFSGTFSENSAISISPVILGSPETRSRQPRKLVINSPSKLGCLGVFSSAGKCGKAR